LSANWQNYVNLALSRGQDLLANLTRHLPASLEHMAKSEDGQLPLAELFSSGAITGILSGFWAALMQGYSLTVFLFNLVLLPFMVYYIAVDFESLHHAFLAIFPGPQRKKIAKLGAQINVLVSAFVRGQLIVCCVLFVLYFGGMLAIGLEGALMLAVISSFGNLIPYFGFILGISLSLLTALVTFGDVTHLLLVLGLFLTVQAVEGTFITPRIMGEKVGISPLVVILAIFANGKLFGLLGIFLAVPIAAIVKVLGVHLRGWVIERMR
jgi:predicted PurR-regulated permease PerM